MDFLPQKGNLMNPNSTQPKLGRWQASKSLARSAWHVLKLDKRLVGLPIFSSVIAVVLAVIVGAVFFFTSSFTERADGLEMTGPLVNFSWISVAFYLAIYLLFTFVATYFSAALISGLLQRFQGKSPTVKSSLKTANEHISSLIMFSILTGVIGYILQAIEERVPLAGKVTTWLVGGAWSIASMFALPVIVSSKEKIGPFRATKKSIQIIKKTWGETAILSVGIGLVALISVVAFIATMTAIGALTSYVVSSIGANNLVVGVSLGAVGLVGVVGLIALGLVFTMLSSIVKAAIYHYATTGESPEGFEKEIIRSSFTPKKASKVFSA